MIFLGESDKIPLKLPINKIKKIALSEFFLGIFLIVLFTLFNPKGYFCVL